MLKLIILRHAKSSWSEPGQSDFERSLNDRGNADLPKIAEALSKRGHIPSTVYCSPANRTKLTMQGLVERWDAKPAVQFVRDMYVGGSTAYMSAIRENRGESPVMLVGHNPTCHGLAMSLTGSGDQDAMADLATKYPTGTATVLEFNVAKWSEIDAGKGHLVDFITPRKL